MYVAGHTEISNGHERRPPGIAGSKQLNEKNVGLDNYELRLTPSDDHAALEIARRQPAADDETARN
jgi:hypothetical protein